MMENDIDYSIVMPVFNEEDGIEQVLKELRSVTPESPIIVVDDGSTDRTATILAGLKSELGLKIIRHSTNRGYGAAIKTGILEAQTDYILTFDGDGQHDPAEISKLIAAAGKSDIVIGARAGNSGQPFSRRPGKWFLHGLANYLARTKLPDLNSGLRLMKKDVIGGYLHLLSDGFSFSTTSTLAMIKDNRKVNWVDIHTRPRNGKSTVNQITHGSQTLLLILRVIVLFDPLRVFLPISGALFVMGFASASWHLATNPAGLADADLLLLISGLLVFLFGLISDQIAEMRRKGK
ncbi:MAG: glycosyltransferase family 2 protein [Deltaproteobacteria bacterium]|nr:glycosyltransferase family 2 protein [Deltaproteobacteria bacterium]